jgi:glycosyltransferase involved in cell wall biosynthesis
MSIILSVIIPTFNRSYYLKKVLEGLQRQSLSNKLYEVLVIDNCSTDDTKTIVLDYSQTVSNIKYIYEPIQGLNIARNRGLDDSVGQYVAYIDDDAVPHTKWAESIIKSFTEVQPQPGVVGGPTLPVWEGSKPTWLVPQFEPAISMINHGTNSRFLHGREFLVGANMAFLKVLLEKAGKFSPGLDRIKNNLLSGGDTAAIEKVKRLGYGVFYEPQVAVDHYISTTRLTRSWFIKRYYWAGYSQALLWQTLDNPSGMDWFKKFAYTIYGFIRNPSHIFWLIRNTEHVEKFIFKCKVHARIGYLAGLLKIISKYY